MPEFVQTGVAPSTDVAFRLKIYMNSLKMSNPTLVTDKNMQEATEPQDPGLMVEKHSLQNKRVSFLEQNGRR